MINLLKETNWRIALIILGIAATLFAVYLLSKYLSIYLKRRKMPYKDKFILTRNEYAFYKILREITDDRGLLICPKVGLKDLFDVIDGQRDYFYYFGKIAQKHVDFVICDEDLRPLYAIELNDSSHEQPKRRESDQFKERLFKNSSIRLISIRARYEYTRKYVEDSVPF